MKNLMRFIAPKGKPMLRSTNGKRRWALLALAAAALTVAASAMAASNSKAAFGFNASEVSGFPTGAAFLTGGGAYDPESGFVHSAGGFRCTSDVSQGPLAGCLAGQGVRWDTANLLRGTSFKCTGQKSEALKPVATDEHTAVLLADFYRAGNGNDESFTAQLIISQNDIAPDIPGVQNVWIQGIGCASGNVNFNAAG